MDDASLVFSFSIKTIVYRSISNTEFWALIEKSARQLILVLVLASGAAKTGVGRRRDPKDSSFGKPALRANREQQLCVASPR
jgi:hypothetical protein